MIRYVIEILCFQAMFLMVYLVFLKKETFFTYNRIYLLITPLLSLVLPFLKITAIQSIVPVQDVVTALPEVILGNAITSPEDVTNTVNTVVSNPSGYVFHWTHLYYLGVLISALFFAYKLFQFKRLFQYREKGKRIIILPESTQAFTFFNYVFLGEKLSALSRKQILAHERIHIKQKHSLDLLFFEVLRIVFWFNPLVYLYQKEITLVHEYLADSYALGQTSKKQYYTELLNTTFDTNHFSFINPFFNHSIIKKRIIMLQKRKSNQVSQLKYLLLIPLILGILIYTSCSTNQNNIEATSAENIENLKYELATGEKLQGEKLKIHQAYEGFLKTHSDHVGWSTISKDGATISYSVHKLSEGIPEGYQELVYNTKDGGSYKVYMNLPETSGTTSNDVVEYTQIEAKEVVEGEENDFPFAVVDEVPVFPGCSGTNKELKECISLEVAKKINHEFDMKIPETLGLTGTRRVTAVFKINEQGDIVDVKARGVHPDVEAEAVRAIKTLPKMTPGKKDGMPVGVLYSLPITFRING